MDFSETSYMGYLAYFLPMLFYMLTQNSVIFTVKTVIEVQEANVWMK